MTLHRGCLFQGPVIPATFYMCGQWIPANERSTLITAVMAGNQISAVISLFLGGVLSDNLGWSSNFYVAGIAGLVFSIFWQIFAHDSPSSHPNISKVLIS